MKIGIDPHTTPHGSKIDHTNIALVAIAVSSGHSEGPGSEGVAEKGEMVLVNPGELHTYWADTETAAYLVYAGLPQSRPRPWSLKQREQGG